MARGGRREGSGRPKGAINKRTEEAIAKAAETGITPLDYLLGLMRDEGQEQSVRLDAAKAAAPYVHAKLQAIQHSGDAENPVNLITRVELVAPDGKS
jgi:hypothetical protein